ncbi:MAG: arsenate reductase [Saprospiraceae bacterium]|jgi:arsenate reductase|tara:strand:- start:1 stop:627 length:627 start_codon:yes stop_codon:yes gene_type:complete
MYKKIRSSIERFDLNSIPDDRKALLDELASYIRLQMGEEKTVNLNFICTHNSRRSHLSQIWAQTMAAYYGVRDVCCYSGGTEATAMFPVVGETLTSQGFAISKLADQKNPVYAIRFDSVSRAMIVFSKKYDDVFNPKSDYGAIMTCASADEGCPVVLGAEIRLPIRYDDPKVSDGTPYQAKVYLERSVQIGTEMKYVFWRVGQVLSGT